MGNGSESAVDAISRRSAVKRPDIQDHLLQAALPGFQGTPGHVRGQAHPVIRPDGVKRMIFRERFLCVNIDSQAANTVFQDCVRQGLLIGDRTACHIDKQRIRLRGE